MKRSTNFSIPTCRHTCPPDTRLSTGCQCDPGLLAVLPAGGVTPSGLAGVLQVVSTTCNLNASTACP